MSEEIDVNITNKIEKTAEAVWWILLIQGIIMLILGIMLFGHPDKGLVVIVALLGTFWSIKGILDVIVGISGHTDASRGWIILGGTIATIAGLIILNEPIIKDVIATEFLPMIIAVSIIINGLSQIFVGLDIRILDTQLFREHSLYISLIGTIYVAGGILLLTHLTWTAITLSILVGIWALVAGIAQIAIALRIHIAARSIVVNAKLNT